MMLLKNQSSDKKMIDYIFPTYIMLYALGSLGGSLSSIVDSLVVANFLDAKEDKEKKNG